MPAIPEMTLRRAPVAFYLQEPDVSQNELGVVKKTLPSKNDPKSHFLKGFKQDQRIDEVLRGTVDLADYDKTFLFIRDLSWNDMVDWCILEQTPSGDVAWNIVETEVTHYGGSEKWVKAYVTRGDRQ